MTEPRTPRTGAGRHFLDSTVPHSLSVDGAPSLRAIYTLHILAIEAEAADAARRDVFREMAVVHEPEPPGVDYATVQIDRRTWEALREIGADHD